MPGPAPQPLTSLFRVPRAGLRRDLWISTADAAAFSVMVGCGETYLPAFALAIGLGPVAAGLVASVPVLVGAVMQLITPIAVERLGTNRGWVVICTTAQAVSFVPLIAWALRGHATLWELLIAASIYWAGGMAGAPAWNSWMGTLVPAKMRTAYFAQRNRLAQFGVFVGFVLGGFALQAGERRGATLVAFAVVFAVAAICRLASTACLLACREPVAPERKPAGTAPPILPRIRGALAEMATAPSGSLVVFLWAFSFSAQVAAPYFTPYMLRERGFSYGAFMLVIATGIFAKAVALPSWGRLGSRIGSARLLWLGAVTAAPLSLLWLVSARVGFLVGVQVVAGASWACYELAMMLLFFDAVRERERTSVITVFNLGLAVATVAGAGSGGLLLRWMGEDQTAYFIVFAVSAALRLLTLPLLRRIRHAAPRPGQLEGNDAS